jgi:hypothetical protein
MILHRRAPAILIAVILPISLGVTLRSSAAEPRVEFELVTEQGLPPTTTQKWYTTLTGLKVAGLRIRGATATDQPKIEEAGTKGRPIFRVIGRIDSRGTLLVPGATFTTADGPKIVRWMRELADNGAEGVTQPKHSFGLTQSQLEEVTRELMRPVGFSTKGLPPAETLHKIGRTLKVPLAIEADVQQALAADDPVRDELIGLSSGTAMAAILRPAGAALVPSKPAGRGLQLRLTSAKGQDQIWPIGWPPQDQPVKVTPKLFEFLNAEIDGVTAAEAINAIRGRLGLPFLFDHNSVVLHEIDLDQLVAIPARRTFYAKVLDQVLYKAGLHYEVRVDENDKPFVWITTLKR